jgi:hypothetical protein
LVLLGVCVWGAGGGGAGGPPPLYDNDHFAI